MGMITAFLSSFDSFFSFVDPGEGVCLCCMTLGRVLENGDRTGSGRELFRDGIAGPIVHYLYNRGKEVILMALLSEQLKKLYTSKFYRDDNVVSRNSFTYSQPSVFPA